MDLWVHILKYAEDLIGETLSNRLYALETEFDYLKTVQSHQ